MTSEVARCVTGGDAGGGRRRVSAEARRHSIRTPRHGKSVDTAPAPAPGRKRRVGWMVGPGFGPVNAPVVANVVAAEAIRGDGHHVEEARIPVLVSDVARDAFDRLHVTAMKPACRDATSGREAEMSRMAKTMLSLPDTSTEDYVVAEQAAERRRGLPPGLRRTPNPVPARPGAQARHRKRVVNGEMVDPAGATGLLTATGLPGLSMRFGTSREGLRINGQLVGRWLAETTLLRAAAVPEGVSPVRGLYQSL